MSIPTIPAILSAIMLAGSAGAATKAMRTDDTPTREARAEANEARKAERETAESDRVTERDARKADTEARHRASLQRVFEAKDGDRALRAKERLEALGKIDGMLTAEQREALAARRGKDKAESKAKHRDKDKAESKAKHRDKDKAESKAKHRDKDKDKAKAKAKAKNRR